MAAISLAVVMVMGVTGAIAALGDTLFPAQSLAAGFAQDLGSGGEHLSAACAILHPMIAAVRGGVADLLRGDGRGAGRNGAAVRLGSRGVAGRAD